MQIKTDLLFSNLRFILQICIICGLFPPLVFNKLLGNEPIKQVLRRMLQNKRIPGSLIFAGDEGVGKRQFALELAKAVLCRDPQNFEACDKCSACLRAVKFQKFPAADSEHRDEYKRVFWSEHADVGIVVPYKNTVLVDAIRDLAEQANIAPFEGKARFFIIDEADKLNSSNDSAANALLKTLEEPAPTTNLILLTARPNSLLQTIKSRCQILRFAPIASAEIEKHLLAAKKFSPNDVKLAARLARGSVGKALDLNLEKYREQREQMLNALNALAGAPDRAGLLKIAEELNEVKFKDEFETRLETLQNLIHDVWTIRLGGETNDIINSDLTQKLAKFAENVDSPRARDWIAAIETLREQLNLNINRKIAADALFMQMANA